MRLFIVLAGLLGMTAVSAHTALSASVPASGAKVTGPVSEVVLEFNGEVRLTAVIVQAADGSEHAVAALPTTAAARFALAVATPLEAGQYTLTWRAVGEDSHIVSGEIPFAVHAG